MKIWLVDAFTNKAFKGNPAGVCIVDSFPAVEFMQNIAFEMGWSQTAFVVKKSDQDFDIRWFSPLDEAPICGHATLAASHILFQENLATDSIKFESLCGQIQITRQNDLIYMNFPLKPVVECEISEKITKAIGVENIKALYKDDSIHIALINSEQELMNLNVDLNLISQLDCRAISVTAKSDNIKYDFVSRYFAPKVGIAEDPVCGSSHCRLVHIWSKILQKNEFKAYQLSKRGGELDLKIAQDRVIIGGNALTICYGNLAF